MKISFTLSVNVTSVIVSIILPLYVSATGFYYAFYPSENSLVGSNSSIALAFMCGVGGLLLTIILPIIQISLMYSSVDANCRDEKK
jgi:hypothetical protein